MESRFPFPPYDAVIDPVIRNTFIVIFGIGAALSLLYAIKKSYDQRDLLPLVLFVGSGCTCIVESMVNLTGLCWYPEINQIVAYQTFGRPIPLYAVLIFFFYFTPVIIYMIERLKSGAGRGWLMKLYGGSVLAAAVFEPIPVHLGVWGYYGLQPFVLFGFPVWWAFVNAACVVLTGIIVYKSLPYLVSWRKFAIIPLMPTAAMASHIAAGYMVQSALNAFIQNSYLTALGAIISSAMSIFLVWLAANIVLETPISEQTLQLQHEA